MKTDLGAAVVAAVMDSIAIGSGGDPILGPSPAGQGKKNRLPKPTKEFEQGPLSRQQRRWLERRGLA